MGPNVSERLRSSREELPVSNDNFTSKIVLVLAHRNIGRVSRAIFFFQAEDGIRDPLWSRGLGDVYKRQENM